MATTKYLGNPEFRIHTRNGDLLRSVKGKTIVTGTGEYAYRISADKSIAPHAPYVFRGTKVMLQRPLIRAVTSSKATQARMLTMASLIVEEDMARAKLEIHKRGSRTSTARQVDIIFKNLAKLTKVSEQAAKRRVNYVGRETVKVIKRYMSMKTYTLAQLAEMDHPYAKRHGSIKVHR